MGTTKTFVRFVLGDPRAEQYLTKEVESRNLTQFNIQDIPIKAFALYFFEKEHYISDDGEDFWGPMKNKSGRYYLGGEILTPKEVKERYPDKEGLHLIMENWSQAIHCRTGHFQQFSKEDSILQPQDFEEDIPNKE